MCVCVCDLLVSQIIALQIMIGSETKEKLSHLCQAKGYLAFQGPPHKDKLRP